MLSLEEGHSSLKHLNLPEMYRNSEYARKILQTTQPILEEFSTSVRTIGSSNEKEITYATSFFSQVGTEVLFSLEDCCHNGIIVSKVLLLLNITIVANKPSY